MILKFLCLVLGLAMIGASFYQSWEEGLWQKQKLVHLFCAYLEDSYGQRYPITSDLTNWQLPPAGRHCPLYAWCKKSTTVPFLIWYT